MEGVLFSVGGLDEPDSVSWFNVNPGILRQLLKDPIELSVVMFHRLLYYSIASGIIQHLFVFVYGAIAYTVSR